jgi:hypothetical protein
MIADNSVTFDTMSEADLEPVMELLQGGNPDAIALKAGISKKHLFRIRDDLLAQVERERARATDAPPKKSAETPPAHAVRGKNTSIAVWIGRRWQDMRHRPARQKRARHEKQSSPG